MPTVGKKLDFLHEVKDLKTAWTVNRNQGNRTILSSQTDSFGGISTYQSQLYVARALSKGGGFSSGGYEDRDIRSAMTSRRPDSSETR